jgi:hypothetical protein
MRTELEFSVKFVVDPAEPVSKHEIEALAGMYQVLRTLQSPPEQLAALGRLVYNYQPTRMLNTPIPRRLPAKHRNDIWNKRRERARAVLAQHADDRFAAARALGISSNELGKWLAGPAKAHIA